MSSFSYSSTSASSTSSFGPSTPNMQCDSDYDTPSTAGGLITPPGTLKDYYRSLKARHTLGMAAAMKSLPIDRAPRSQSMHDLDDNPFDRLYIHSPTGLPRSDTFGSLAGHLARADQCAGNDVDMLSRTESRDVEVAAPWRPSLLQFSRKGSDSAHGSYSSESSFEGGSAGDHLRVYGRPDPAPVDDDDSPFSLSAYLQPSPALFVEPIQPFSHTDTKAHVGSDANMQIDHRMSVASTMTTSSVASSSTIMSASSAGTVTIGSAHAKRPSMLRPRPRAHPYEIPYEQEGGMAFEPTGASAGDGRGMSFSTEKQEMADDGRSVSEVMIAMAGLRCQRGRNKYRPKA